jgi:hypothetical protein
MPVGDIVTEARTVGVPNACAEVMPVGLTLTEPALTIAVPKASVEEMANG